MQFVGRRTAARGQLIASLLRTASVVVSPGAVKSGGERKSGFL
jgi:hypothetical protein